MSAARTLLASLLVVAAGGAALAAATSGFQAFTTDTARRIDVRAHPRALPPAVLQTASGELTDLASLRGRWVLVNFIYTRCVTYCSVQGGEVARLQERLERPIADDRIALLSISFDPARDGPVQLADYQRRMGGRGRGWLAVRPVSAGDLTALMRAFGVTAVPDGLGGYVHNAAFAVVDPAGRLVDILDWDDADGAARYLEGRVAP